MHPPRTPGASISSTLAARSKPGGHRCRRSALPAGALSVCALVSAGGAAAAGLPNPCAAVPSAAIASALGLKHAPTSSLATLPKVTTCSFAGGKLTVAVGFTTLPNPAVPAKIVRVPGLPNGTYRTYAGSTQTEVLFFKGTAATGIYGVVRNFVRIPKLKLEAIARALSAAITPAGRTQSTPSVKLVSG